MPPYTKMTAAIACVAMLALDYPLKALANDDDQSTIIVNLSGLDLTTAAGHADAERRIARAAARIAGEPTPGDLQGGIAYAARRDDIARTADLRLDRLIARAQPPRNYGVVSLTAPTRS